MARSFGGGLGPSGKADACGARRGRAMLEQRLVDAFASRGRTLAFAESVTGGLVSARLTDVPGASRVLVGGFVTYQDEGKRRLLGLDVDGDAVTARVAADMARACRERAGVDVAVSLTGLAGPDAPPGLPVGLVFLGVASAAGVRVVERRFPGSREDVRNAAAEEAFRLALEEVEAS